MNRQRAHSETRHRTNVKLSSQAYDDIATYQSEVYGNNQMVLAKNKSKNKMKHQIKNKAKATLKHKHKHRKCISLGMLLNKLKDRMIDMDELSSVMISKHKMQFTVFENDKFMDKRGVFDVFRGVVFELRFNIHQTSQLPDIYCMKSVIPHHPNIDPQTGMISLSYNIKYYIKSKKKYVEKIWSLIVSLVTVLESPSLFSETDILNKTAAAQFRRGSDGAITNGLNGANKNDIENINAKQKWTKYIDLDAENKKRKHEKQMQKNKDKNKKVTFNLSVPKIDKSNIGSIDFDSKEMKQLAATISVIKGFKLSC